MGQSIAAPANKIRDTSPNVNTQSPPSNSSDSRLLNGLSLVAQGDRLKHASEKVQKFNLTDHPITESPASGVKIDMKTREEWRGEKGTDKTIYLGDHEGETPGDEVAGRVEKKIDFRDHEGEKPGDKVEGGVENNSMEKIELPLKQGDCAGDMKTENRNLRSKGKCHQPVQRNKPVGPEVKERQELNGRPAKKECRFYLSSGRCRNGSTCWYRHSLASAATSPIPQLNFLDLPIRPSEKDCSFYMRNGSCKFGLDCKFNHPDPSIVGVKAARMTHANGGSSTQRANAPVRQLSTKIGRDSRESSCLDSTNHSNESAPALPVILALAQGAPLHTSESSEYKLADRTGRDVFVHVQEERKGADKVKEQVEPKTEVMFPERPGEPKCCYSQQNGNCKLKSNCKYHHPKNTIKKQSSCSFSDKSLPLRHGNKMHWQKKSPSSAVVRSSIGETA